MTNPSSTCSLARKSREFVQQSAFFKPLPFVKRVVFISTPQHGAMLAASRLVTGLAAKLVNLPITVVNTTALMAQIATASGDEKVAAMLSRPMTSIDDDEPEQPRSASSGIHTRCIGYSSTLDYRSRRRWTERRQAMMAWSPIKARTLMRAVSEVVVHWSHSCQGRPEVIEEIKRILFEHLAASETKKP